MAPRASMVLLARPNQVDAAPKVMQQPEAQVR